MPRKAVLEASNIAFAGVLAVLQGDISTPVILRHLASLCKGETIDVVLEGLKYFYELLYCIVEALVGGNFALDSWGSWSMEALGVAQLLLPTFQEFDKRRSSGHAFLKSLFTDEEWRTVPNICYLFEVTSLMQKAVGLGTQMDHDPRATQTFLKEGAQLTTTASLSTATLLSPCQRSRIHVWFQECCTIGAGSRQGSIH